MSLSGGRAGARQAPGVMTPEEAVYDFTGEGYRRVRGYQMGRIRDDGTVGQQARIIEQFISENGGLSGKTYRGIVLESVPTYAKGDIINMYGTSSWSTSLNTARKFGSPKLYGTYGVIFTCEGQKRGVDVSAFSDAAHESEVLVSKDSRWTVSSVKKKGSIYYVSLKEV